MIYAQQHPELINTVMWLARRGELVRLLPGTYCAPAWSDRPAVRMRAVVTRYPDAVLTGAAAARASFWPTAPLSVITVAVPKRTAAQPGFVFSRRPIPPELIAEVDGLRLTAPALTAVDLATFDSSDAIDVALRSRFATLDGMHDALRLTAGRARNNERRAVLVDSRDEPWSAPERTAHRLLRSAGVIGWKSNLPVLAGGRRYFIDIAFKDRRLAIEIDGRIHQLDPALFQSDRIRQNDLVLEGWRVLRFTWQMIEDQPDRFIAAIVDALA